MYRRECIYDIGLFNNVFKMREGHELRTRFEKKFQTIKMCFMELGMK